MKTAALNLKALKACNLFASNEQARFYLCGVYVTVTERASRYIAMDGHRMLVHRDDLKEGAEPNTLLGSWIIPRTAIAAMKGGTGRFDNAPAVLGELGEGKFSLEAPKGSVMFQPIDGRFPDAGRVIPCATAGADKLAHNHFNLLYGADFAKAAELLGAGLPFIHQAEADHPLPVTFGGDGKTFGVLMPLRGSAEPWQGTLDWFNMG